MIKAISGYFEAGGVVMPWLLLVSLVLWGLILERWLYLFGPIRFFGGFSRSRTKHEIRLFESEAAKYLSSLDPRAAQDLHDSCERNGGEVAGFVHRALLEHGTEARDSMDLSLDESARAYSMKIRRGLSLLGTLSKLAPMLGLLGTVAGMIQAFQTMMLSGGADAKALSGGISAALITTQVGLVVALPGLFTRSLFARRAQSLEEGLEILATRIKCAAGKCEPRRSGGRSC